MSNVAFPILKGQNWPVVKTPAFRNIIQQSVSGKRKALALTSYPIWTIKVGYEVLTDTDSQDDDIHTLMGFFLKRQGNFDDFLFFDKTDHAVVNQVFAVADGITTQFQLVRTYGGYVEPIFGIVEIPVIKADGVVVVPSSITPKGKVVFSAAPSSGAVLSWTGTFYYRVAFVEPESEFENFMRGLWSNKSLELVTVK